MRTQLRIGVESIVAVVVKLGRREEAKAERRQRIIAAARDLIRQTGDTDLSMRMIAKKAKVSLATPYNLFGSKRDVVLAVMYEDERDFDEKFATLHPGNAIDHIFQAALSLAVGYYTADPSFYRTLWQALLDTYGKGGASFSRPERRAHSHALWTRLIERAQREGYLDRGVSADAVERSLAHCFNGVMLSWIFGAIDTAQMLPAAGCGYGLMLQGAATCARGARRIAKKIASYEKTMTRRTRRAVAALITRSRAGRERCPG